MLRVYAHHYINIGASFHDISALFWSRDESDPITEEEKADLTKLITELKKTCDQIELPVSAGMLKRALSDLPQSSREIDTLMATVKQEIRTHLFLFVPPHRARYYEANVTLPQKLQTALPAASKEIVRASNCYAYGEYTACVFHAMLAAELGLRAVAKHLKVPLSTPIESAEWQTLINLIDGHLKKLGAQTKTAARDEELKFFGDANSQFLNFKEAFRKHVSHARDSYEEVPSISVLHRAREFLETLSTKVAE